MLATSPLYMSENTQTNSGFENLGIAEKILASIKNAGLTEPTPIQRKSIPTAIQGKDLVGIAQTGTGKTLAYSIPMIQRLALYKGRGLVLVPTRELALQVNENFKNLSKIVEKYRKVLKSLNEDYQPKKSRVTMMAAIIPAASASSPQVTA